MFDPTNLDKTQIVNGIAVLLSFFVGYKYALKRNELNKQLVAEAAASASLKGPVLKVQQRQRVNTDDDESAAASASSKIPDDDESSCEETVKVTNDWKHLPLTKNYSGQYKMVLVVRNDLKMGKGKVAAQCAHAAVGAVQKAMRRIPSVVRVWENQGSAKIALKVESEKEMMVIMEEAQRRALVVSLIRDAGRTQIAPNTKTVLAIGPSAIEPIDEVTGHLKLL